MSMAGSDWRSFMRRHRGVVALLVLAGALAFVGAIYVFLWFVSNAQSSGIVPTTLGLWTMADLVNFILHAVFWELLLVGVPVAIAAAAAWQWWKRISREDSRGYDFGRGSRSTGSGGGLSLLFFIAFCIKVYIDGKWDVAIGSFTVNYVVGSMVTILEWGLIILGIPAVIALAWWLNREMKR
jgi:hypothetical protein